MAQSEGMLHPFTLGPCALSFSFSFAPQARIAKAMTGMLQEEAASLAELAEAAKASGAANFLQRAKREAVAGGDPEEWDLPGMTKVGG